jgi:hypothetical protein
MRKWLLAGSVLLLGLLGALLYLIRSPTDAAVAATRPDEAATTRVADQVPAATAAKPAPAPLADDGKPKKIDPKSDKMIYRFDDRLPGAVTSQAAKCYHRDKGRKDRHQKITIEYIAHVKDGEVTISDVKMTESTLKDPELEKCMVARAATAHWHDDALPDYTWNDELVIRPEDGMKKYIDEEMKYEGSGPIKNVQGVPVPAPGHEDDD